MTSAAPSKRQHKTNSLPSEKGVRTWYSSIFRTSVGGKFLVAITGIGLTGFVIGHMLGNLQVFLGREPINRYAQMLKDTGILLWLARGGLLFFLILHMFLSIRLQQRAMEARPIPYFHEDTIKASFASRHMLMTGLVIFVFLLFHLAHYTFGWIGTATLADGRQVGYLDLRDQMGRHDVYSMTILGLRNPIIVILYLVGQVLLLLHLSHGVGSVFQTLGANSPRWQLTVSAISWGVALIVGLGNIAIVVAIWAGMVKLPPGIVAN